MRVVDARRPGRLRESGTATVTVEYVDDQLLETPAGRFLAKRIVSRFVADLKLVHATTTSTTYVVPGVGVVAQQRVEEIKMLGLGSPSRLTFVLTSPPAEVTTLSGDSGAP